MSANPNVNVKISIVGKDSASKELDRVGRSAGKLGDDLRRAAGASDAAEKRLGAATETSGRLSTALGALGDFAGHSQGKMRMAADAAGAFEDVLKVLPGPLGLAAGAVAGLTAVLYLQRREAEQTRAAIAQAFSPDLAREVQAMAGAYDLSREAALALGTAMQDTGQSAEDVRVGLQAALAAAEDIGEDGSAAVLRFAKGMSEGVTEADRMVGRMQRLGIELVKVNIELAKRAGFDNIESAAKQSDDKIKQLTADLEKLDASTKALRSGDAGKFKDIADSTTFVDKLAALAGKRERLTERMRQAAVEDTKQVLENEATAAQIREQLTDIATHRANLSETITEAAKVEAEETQKAADAEMSAAQATYEREKAEAKLQRRRASAGRGGDAKAAAAKAAAEAKAFQDKRDAQWAEFEAAVNAPDDRDFDIGVAERQSARLTAAAYADLEDRVLAAYQSIATDPARKAALDQQRIQIDLAREEAKIRGDLFIEEADQIRAIAALREEANTKIAASQAAARDATLSQVQAWAGAGQAVAGALLEGDAAARASAGLQAIISGADAFKYFAAGNIPGGIASAAAAIGYAKAALMPAPPTPGGGGTQPAKPAAPDRSGGPSNTTINISGIMTTKAEVGAAIKKAMKAAQPTGMAPA